MKLVIVESPTKAKTISRFLGKEFTVKSSYGHVRDLPKKEMGVDIEHDFTPEYEIPDKAAARVSELKKLAKKSNEVILATDEDREGEAISWHLLSALELGNKKTQRIAFHEITKPAIIKALDNPREIDMNLVDAQQARRVLDRLVGYELSPFLWKKIRRGLSAGRVQSVALRLIVEREREIGNFKTEDFWTIPLKLKKKGDKIENAFSGELVEKNGEKTEKTVTLKLFAGDYKTKKTIFDEKSAAETTDDLKSADIRVADIIEKETLRYPAPPFTTSSLQQAAINNLGWSAKSTMMTAQKLYEQGHITYMRTDSVNLSLESMLQAKKTIENEFGKDFALAEPRFFKTKSKGAQEAHEAIRPSYPGKRPGDLKDVLDANQLKLYRLIWERMIATQMQPAVFDSVKAEIEAKGESADTYRLRATGSTLKFEGFLKAFSGRKTSEENLLPKLEKNEALEIAGIETERKSTTPPPRYSEAGLVKIMEENGIGRPSTYAPTISTLIERKYIEHNEEKRLYPLEIGMLVNDLLVEHFSSIVDTGFTATIEEDFDKIALGEKEWVPVIRDFYGPFHKNLLEKTKAVKKESLQEKVGRSCPECGNELVVKFGRFGKFIACSNYPKCRYTEKTGAEKEMQEKIEKETGGETCEVCGAPMIVKRGKYGMFLGCSNYPECKNIKKIENKLGIKCPKCGAGEIVERKSKRGKVFYSCNQYPKCDFALWQKPTGEKCPQCGNLLVHAAKGKEKCSNKECGYEK